MPEVPGPDEVPSQAPVEPAQLEHIPQKLRRWFNRFGPFEFRQVQLLDPVSPEPRAPNRQLWFRLRGEVPDDQGLHRALLAYASDFHLVGTATLPHGLSLLDGRLLVASLDHAMWFHRDLSVTDWLLYACDSPSTSGSRGLARGLIYDRQGRLVASTAQEGMIRLRESEEVDS
jgi:acyl-CoA thioesterase-2